MTKAILVVSDLHCGSIFGMLPPDFEASDDRVVPQNAGQKYLWECWENMCKRVSGYGVNAVVVNGDVIDGTQGAQRGVELTLPLMADQAEAAKQCLGYLKQSIGKHVPFFFTQGTEYHEGKGAREAEAVAEALKARSYKGAGSGRYSREVLDLVVDDVRINFAHHVSTSSGFYKATAIDREGAFASLATRQKIDAIVRSHVHYFFHDEYPRRHNIVTPCWQLQTRFMRHQSVFKMIPDIGAIVLWVNGSKKVIREDPIVLEKILYDLPETPMTKL